MSYLPQAPVNNTAFPKGTGYDMKLHVGLLEEKWKRFYPLIPYSPILREATPVTIRDGLSGEVATTKVDELYGEAVPDAPKWKQPHGTVGLSAPNPELYADPISVNLRVYRNPEELDMTEFGFDRFRDLVVVVPLSILDSLNISVKIGDKFTYGEELFHVLQYERKGFWKNTSIRLYMAMNCTRKHIGS